MNTSVLDATRFNDRSLIESIVGSFYIVDYGFVTAVNSDKTINVTHAKLLKTREGANLSPTKTSNIEVLTISCKGFSLFPDIKKGDKVLLLGLKDYVDKVKNINTATDNTFFLHYSRETLKALPLCIFDDSAKVKIEIDAGNLNITTEKDVNIKCSNAKIETSSYKIVNKAGIAALEVTP